MEGLAFAGFFEPEGEPDYGEQDDGEHGPGGEFAVA